MGIIDFRKLLPDPIRSGRWGDIAEVVQSVLDDIKVNKIDIIKTQYQLENMTDAQLIDIALMFGYVVNSFDGYTSTTHYLTKQVLTLIPRVLNKTTRPGYQFLFHIYNLRGNIYPTYLDSLTTTLIPITSWWTLNEDPAIYDTLDAGADFVLFNVPFSIDTELELDTGISIDSTFEITRTVAESSLPNATLDTEVFPHLDMISFLESITRHIVISYEHKFIEETGVFLSDNSLLAFHSDVLQMKRRTEVPYFEPNIVLTATDDNNLTTTALTSYDAVETDNIESILIGADLSDATTIRFGNSSHDTVDGSITDVKNLISSITIDGGWRTETLSPDTFIGRKVITQKNTFYNFTEIALLDSLGNCIFYAKFPLVSYISKMYANVALNISITS